MKTFNQHNFFKHTFCEFVQVDDFDFPQNTNYKSKSNSFYVYTDKGVYRKSNHWGRVANCRWKLISNSHYKNQQTVVGFAKWTDFYPINSIEKLFFIEVDFNQKKAKIRPKEISSTKFLFTFSEAQKRAQQIQYFFKHNQWTRYYDIPLEELYRNVIVKLTSTNKTLQEIKNSFK